MQKYACQLFLNIFFLCDKVLYDPAELLYYNQRILGLIEISDKSKTDSSLIYLILKLNSSLFSFEDLFLSGCCGFRAAKEIIDIA